MSEGRIQFKVSGKEPHQRTTITGLTSGDLRTIARAVDAGAFQGGDNGGPVSEALVRFAHALRQPAQYGRIGQHTIVGGTSDATRLYDDLANLPNGGAL